MRECELERAGVDHDGDVPRRPPEQPSISTRNSFSRSSTSAAASAWRVSCRAENDIDCDSTQATAYVSPHATGTYVPVG